MLRGGPVVLLISDGWDRGDPSELREQIARLQRSCHRLIWLNPLIGTADYAPLTRGLQAALPFVDDFLPVRTLTNLAELAIHLNTPRLTGAQADTSAHDRSNKSTMDITGSYTFDAPPDRVWTLLMDPAVLVVLHSRLQAIRAGNAGREHRRIHQQRPDAFRRRIEGVGA